MRPSSLLSLPLPLLLVLPQILPSTASSNRRDRIPPRNEAGQQLPPRAGVKKMSEDEGEKFFFDYWYFDDLQEEQEPGNSSLVSYRPPFPLHNDDDDTSTGNGLLGRGFFNLNIPRDLIFSKRQGFQCPKGTSSCSSINRPNSCCAEGETCQIIRDTGLGDVGCCASGDGCAGGSVGECDDGYTSCPNNPGGGCCIPGYECKGEGCVIVRTQTVTVRPTRTRTRTEGPTATSTSTSTTGSETETESSTTASTTQTIAPPVRPTTNPPVTTTSGAEPPACPTGFYACSAVYHGGCCRIGRDCQSTSCPTPSSTTLVNENGNTIVVPVTGTLDLSGASPTGVCADGWFKCGDDNGGGCCPQGFGCDVESCTATGKDSPTGEIGKIALEGGVGRVMAMGESSWCALVLAVAVSFWL